MENKNIKFNISLSNRGYETKEEGKEFANRLGFKKYSITLEELINYIKNGYAYCYCFTSGKTDNGGFVDVKRSEKPEYFISTQIVAFDLDYMPINFDEFISSIDLKPTYAYTSYSYNENNNILKYRLIYLLNEPVFTQNDFYCIYNNIANQLNLYSFEYIDKKDGKSKPSFDVRKINQFYFGTNSSTDNFKDYISYNVYNTNDFLSININDIINYKNKYNTTHIIQNSNNDTLKNTNCSLDNIEIDYHFDITNYKTHSDYIESNSIYYSYLPEEYFAIYSVFNGYSKEKIRITNGSRTKALYAVGQVFKYLNPEISENELASFLNYWLNTNCVNDEDKITKKDIVSLVKSIFNTEFNGKVKKHNKIKVNMVECNLALQSSSEYGCNYTALDCVHFARKEKTNDEILSNYDFSTTVSENLKNLKSLGINTTYQTINNVMKRTGLDKYSEKFNLQDFIMEQIESNPSIKQKDIIEMLQDKVSKITVKRMFTKLQEDNIIINKGTKKEPLWKKC